MAALISASLGCGVELNNALADMLSDFSRLPEVTDRLQQSLVTTMVLVRTMTGRIVNDAALLGLAPVRQGQLAGVALESIGPIEPGRWQF